MIRALIVALAVLMGGCVAHSTQPPAPVSSPGRLAVCVGPEVVVWNDDPVPCDVVPPQVLTILGISEPECDRLGGRYEYEACVGVDY